MSSRSEASSEASIRAPARSSEELLAEYRTKGLGARVGYGKRPAVLVVDFVQGFTDPDSPLGSDFSSQLEATFRLLAAARRRGLPVVFTTTVYAAGEAEASLFVRKVPSLEILRKGSEAVALDAKLRRRDREILIEKQYASAFFGTSLASTLTASGVDTVLVAGCTTSGCVRASVVDALQYGFRPVVPAECVGDRAAEPHTANLLDIDAKYGDVVGLEEALTYVESLTDRKESS